MVGLGNRTGISIFLAAFPIVQLFQLYGRQGEEAVVEFHDLLATAPVVFQNYIVDTKRGEISFHALSQQTPVTVTPTIDALLDITHDQGPPTFGKSVHDQRQEIAPLHGRGVLKLVDHDMFVKISRFLEQKRGVVPGDQHVEQAGRVTQ